MDKTQDVSLTAPKAVTTPQEDPTNWGIGQGIVKKCASL